MTSFGTCPSAFGEADLEPSVRFQCMLDQKRTGRKPPISVIGCSCPHVRFGAPAQLRGTTDVGAKQPELAECGISAFEHRLSKTVSSLPAQMAQVTRLLGLGPLDV